MATDDEAVIISVRLWLPKEKREFEMRASRKLNVDAVFVGSRVVKQILIPYYSDIIKDSKKAKELEREIAKQGASGIVCVPHQATCKKNVPDIERGAWSIDLSPDLDDWR